MPAMQPPEKPPERPKIKLFAGMRQNKGYVLKASLLALLFWVLQFTYQYYVLVPNELNSAFVRSFALSGATLISTALIIGPLARLTKYNFIFHRRTFGVWGFTFITLHFFSVLFFFYNFDISALLWNLNPFVNLVVFGLMAFSLFVPLYFTSTDWAVNRLGFKRWKIIHRLVYFAYIFAVLHYTQINPELLYNPAGYLLITATILALSLQTIAFVKTIKKTRSKKAIVIGSLIILFGIILFYVAFSGVFKQ